MREPTFLILAALAGEPLHGYGITRAVERLSDGRMQLRAGTLYAALERLVDEALIDARHDKVVDGRLRRYYAITESGRTALRTQLERLELNAAVARRQLELGA